MDSFVDKDDRTLPSKILDDLVDKKFIVRSGDHYHFRHDLIKAYLASKFFAPRWQGLLVKPVAIDSNWHSMLKLVILDFANSDMIKDLLYVLINNNKQLAGDLFRSIQDFNPELCKDWADDFKHRFGAAMLVGVE
jgi:hypothetical protein